MIVSSSVISDLASGGFGKRALEADSCIAKHEFDVAFRKSRRIVFDDDCVSFLIEPDKPNTVNVADAVKRSQFMLADGRFVVEHYLQERHGQVLASGKRGMHSL